MKTAIVTGSIKGIGKSIGIELLKKGVFVIFNYANDDGEADALNNELISDYKDMYKIIKADLSNINDVNKFADDCIKSINKVDYLILNAGCTDRSVFGEITVENWNKVMNVNLNMPFFIVQRFSKYINDNEGRIIFIGSIMGIEPHSMSLAYGVSKAGVHFLTKALVKEFAERKITVNAIAPGFVDTAWQTEKPEAQRKRIEEKIALKRFALPIEISKMVNVVIDNEYINGAVLKIDGGYDYK